MATEVSGNKLGICLLKTITLNFPISFIFFVSQIMVSGVSMKYRKL